MLRAKRQKHAGISNALNKKRLLFIMKDKEEPCEIN